MSEPKQPKAPAAVKTAIGARLEPDVAEMLHKATTDKRGKAIPGLITYFVNEALRELLTKKQYGKHLPNLG